MPIISELRQQLEQKENELQIAIKQMTELQHNQFNLANGEVIRLSGEIQQLQMKVKHLEMENETIKNEKAKIQRALITAAKVRSQRAEKMVENVE